jgi:hypothetical protein
LRAFFSGELGSSIQNQRPVHKEIKRKRGEMRGGAAAPWSKKKARRIGDGPSFISGSDFLCLERG